jgi:TonB-dependent receptor
MQMKTAIKLLIAAIFFLGNPFFLSGVAAQNTNGNIKGQVTDKEGSPLPGASVTIKGSTRGVTTDLSGNFLLLNVKAGKYTLVINYMGYAPSELNVQAKAGETVSQNVVLSVAATSLAKVTVSSSAREGQQKALNQQRNADNIKQVVSADLMGRYPDLNVAEALQRLPGVTINRNNSGEGSTVQLRGTPANFTNINVNGEQIMGTQEDGSRNASLDVVPVNVLSSMEVIKTLTSDLDGDAIAGVINMKSPTATSLKTKLSLDAAAGYNNLRSDLNGIGNFAVGKRFFASDNAPNGRLGIMVNGSLFKTKNGYDETNAQVWQLKDFGDGKGSIYFPTDARYLYVENKRTRKGASATIDYVFSPTTNIVANFMYSDHFNEITRYRKRTRMQTANTTKTATGPYTTTRGRSYNEVKSATEDDQNMSFNLQGETTIGKVKLDGGIFLNHSEFENRSRTFNFITGNIPLTITDISSDMLLASGTDWKNNSSLFTYNTVENDYWNTNGKNFVTKLNLTLPYKIGDNSATFKMGFKTKSMHNKRYRPENTLVSTYTGAAATGRLTNFSGLAEVSDDLLDGATNFGLGVDKDKTISFFDQGVGFTQDMAATRNSIDTYFFDAVENVTAGYLMNRIQFKRWMLLGGLRIESTSVDYKGNIVAQDANSVWQSTTPTQKKTQYTKFLPNLQGKFDINSSTLLRGGLTFGYSRPNFVDLVPGRITNILSQTVTDGNPNLQPAFATNLDLAIEKYLSNLGILSAGVFYKNIEKFQYNSVTVLKGDEFENATNYIGWQYFQTLNGNTANVFGIELNAQANLTFLPGFLKGFSILANYTYAHSKADAQFRKGLRLPGQADHTANGSLSYAYKGLTLQGNVNYNASYTVALGSNDATDVIQASRVQVDLNGSLRLNKRFTVYAEVLNLTNAPKIQYFGQRDRIYQKQYYSYWGRAGVKFRL